MYDYGIGVTGRITNILSDFVICENMTKKDRILILMVTKITECKITVLYSIDYNRLGRLFLKGKEKQSYAIEDRYSDPL